MCLDVEVGALAIGTQERRRGTLPTHVALGHVVEADAILHGAVEVVAEGDADALGRPDEPFRQGIVADLLRDVEGTARAVELVDETLVVLRLPEVGQDSVVAPAVVAEIAPRVVVEAVAADVDHRVDRRAAAERATLRIVHPAIVQLGLRHGRESPVDVRARELREARRHMDQRIPVPSTCLEQQDPVVRLLAQAGGDGASGGAGADDDVRVALAHAFPPERCGVSGIDRDPLLGQPKSA